MKLLILVAFSAALAAVVDCGINREESVVSNGGNFTILDEGDVIALDLLNSFRSNHQATSRLTYNTVLAQEAVNCANSIASMNVEFNIGHYATQCANPAYGAIIGFSPLLSRLEAIRYVISDGTPGLGEPFGWWGGYETIVAAEGADPFRIIPYQDVSTAPETATAPRHIRARGYLQMIWLAAKTVGCGHSSRRVFYRATGAATATEVRIVVCQFNVRADYGNFAAQLTNIKPKLMIRDE